MEPFDWQIRGRDETVLSAMTAMDLLKVGAPLPRLARLGGSTTTQNNNNMRTDSLSVLGFSSQEKHLTAEMFKVDCNAKIAERISETNGLNRLMAWQHSFQLEFSLATSA